MAHSMVAFRPNLIRLKNLQPESNLSYLSYFKSDTFLGQAVLVEGHALLLDQPSITD